MARPRGSMSAAIDPLFEFDAPQTFVDLIAPLSPFPPGAHDPWFDQIHPEHSKPSAELAKELADAVRKLQDKEQQLKDAGKSKSNSRRDHRWSLNKENQQPMDWREIVATRNKQLQQKKRSKFKSLKEMRATQEPFKLQKTKVKVKTVSAPSSESRKPLRDLGNSLNSGWKRAPPEKEMKDLHELLKKHNKKFKTTHTYEPPQHSVREVKQWERETSKSYYALSAEERVQANQEITIWKQRRQMERSR
ncbi:hypothetical protein PPTG_12766 [Phytophthora nicotianae INRA-310]|uniref:Uncharacterized protein n=1 Tax=Phytophthora nicotianae (strain INRA-310) TaxID=761204 RepID=W2Q0T6_PHYN3|nr:hypothetical protein PPTG_12766 [Phytophthora nicotianae INRA-310]ETN06727.1 hypothetical protein PPTG_12766 [Phytophthora nicotianae INRA-310]